MKLAELSLANAQRQFENTVLRAPVAGIITEVRAQPGEAVGNTPVVSLADLAAPQVRFWVEESDLMSVAPGNPRPRHRSAGSRWTSILLAVAALAFVFAGTVASAEVTPLTVVKQSASRAQAVSMECLAMMPCRRASSAASISSILR